LFPAPTEVEYPTLLEFPAPVLLAYPWETVIAEKLEALTKLGLLNSRMKDYYDLALLSRSDLKRLVAEVHRFASPILSAAVGETTFKSRWQVGGPWGAKT